MKVALGIPSGDMVHADFANSLATLTAFCAGTQMCDIAIINQKSSIVEKGRHYIIKKAMEKKADKILFLDSDMIFPRETLLRLLHHKKNIVGCNYPTRRMPIQPTCRDKGSNTLCGSKGLKEVGFIATGCLLIDMKVFKKIGEPYFVVEWDRKRKAHIGEDYQFCDRVRHNGFKIFCDFDLSNRIFHIGTHLFNINDVQEKKKENLIQVIK